MTEYSRDDGGPMAFHNVDEIVGTATGSFQTANVDNLSVVPEAGLREIAVRFRHLSTRAEDSQARLYQKQLEVTLQSVIRTAGSIQLAESHAAAACDALRGCLAQCESADDAEIRALAYSKNTWVDIFHVFLTTVERRKPKPLKLLLAALERNLTQNPFQSVKNDLIALFSFRAWQSISAQQEINAVKPFLQALQLFLSKSLIQPRDILGAVSQLPLGQNQLEIADLRGYDASLDSFSVSQCFQYSHVFLCKALAWVRYPDTARIAGRVVSTFCCSMRTCWSSCSTFEHTGYDDQPLWLSAFRSFLRSHPHRFDLLATHVLPEILRQDREGTETYLQKLQAQKVHSIMGCDLEDLQINLFLLHRNMEVGSYKSIAFSLVINSSSSKDFLTENALRSIRCALPSYHAEVNPKFRQENVVMIKRLISRLATSLKSSNVLSTALSAPRPSSLVGPPSPTATATSRLEGHCYGRQQDFLAWYFGFLNQELSPTASYQRHVVSLQILEYFLSSIPNIPHWTETNSNGHKHEDPRCGFDDELLVSLLDLATDPFDDVRDLATSILGNYSKAVWSGAISNVCGKSVQAQTVPFLAQGRKDGTATPFSLHKATVAKASHRAMSNMQSTGRADHADGFGRLYNLVHGAGSASDRGSAWNEGARLMLEDLMLKLEQCVAVARANLHLAVQAASLHGYLITTRYLVLQINQCGLTDLSDAVRLHVWRRLSHRLLEISSQVWKAVKVILCADAPEGHEVDSKDGDVAVNTKDLLSYCWRALKESSTLMHSMIAGAQQTRILHVFEHVHYWKFGELALEQLAELRHRGAFSTVSQTFAECCLWCARSDDSETQALPKEWYQKTLSCIEQRASALTRRSAGLPAMITGILGAYPGGEFFDTVMRDLQGIANSASDIKDNGASIQLPQVHAFNCLKDVFTESKFGGPVEPHMSVTLEIAVRGIESDQYERSLMKPEALISRLKDGTNTRSSELSSSLRRLSSFVYDKYQNLPDLVLRLLTPVAANKKSDHLPEGTVPDASVLQAQHVFPALEIIEQSGIPNQYSSEIRQAAWTHLEGPVWSIREKAAKALSHLFVGEGIQHEMERCLQCPWPSQNALHGRHLYLRFLFARMEKDAIEPIQRIFTQVVCRFQDMIMSNCCPITRSSYTALVADILSATTSHGTALERFLAGETDNCTSPSVFGTSGYMFSAAHWQSFTMYLCQDSPTKPEFALEDATKRRGRLLVESLGEQSEQKRSRMGNTSQYIFMDHGIRGIPKDPEHSDYILRQTGGLVADWSTRADQEPILFTERMECWARALRLAQDENADVSTRQAAVDSLSVYLHMTKHQPVEKKITPRALKLYVILYDFLLDDDEDVRNIGAAAASELFMSTASNGDDDAEVLVPLMVPATRHKLLQFLKSHHHNSPYLWTEAVQRLVAGHPSADVRHPSTLPSPKAWLHELKRDSTALYVEEKQNLYIDEAQEAGVWQEVMLSIDRSASDSAMVAELGRWAAEGLAALLEVAEEEEDGPLGWTSKPGVFTFGARVLLAAQAVLRLAEDETSGVDIDGLLARLQRLAQVGARNSLRLAWMRIIRVSLDDRGLS
ncbi:MAG: hypothetical protein Q9211_003859 [Gyalolechia sp. 1 TL-2023]